MLVQIAPESGSFYVGGPSSSVGSGGVISSMGCLVPQPFASGENWTYPDFWAVTGDLWYPGYKSPTVATEPSVERVTGVTHSMGGRIGTHTLLHVLPRDSVVRPWG
jgi:hypothetical protein